MNSDTNPTFLSKCSLQINLPKRERKIMSEILSNYSRRKFWVINKLQGELYGGLYVEPYYLLERISFICPEASAIHRTIAYVCKARAISQISDSLAEYDRVNRSGAFVRNRATEPAWIEWLSKREFPLCGSQPECCLWNFESHLIWLNEMYRWLSKYFFLKTFFYQSFKKKRFGKKIRFIFKHQTVGNLGFVTPFFRGVKKEENNFTAREIRVAFILYFFPFMHTLFHFIIFSQTPAKRPLHLHLPSWKRITTTKIERARFNKFLKKKKNSRVRNPTSRRICALVVSLWSFFLCGKRFRGAEFLPKMNWLRDSESTKMMLRTSGI